MQLKKYHLCQASLMACLLLPVAARADIVTNGGFESLTGQLNSGTGGGALYGATGWAIVDPNTTADPGTQATGVCSTGGAAPCGGGFVPHNGSNAFWGGAYNGGQGNNPTGLPGTVSQTLLPDVNGQKYTLSFYLAEVGGGADKYWNVMWNGVTVDSGTQSAIPYTLESVTVTGTGGSDALKFSFYDNGGTAYLLDDVSVTATAPEPGSVTLLSTMLFGLAGLVAVFRKKLS